MAWIIVMFFMGLSLMTLMFVRAASKNAEAQVGRESIRDKTPWCYFELCAAIARYLGEEVHVPGRRNYRSSSPAMYRYEDDKVRITFSLVKQRTEVYLKNYPEHGQDELVLSISEHDVLHADEPLAYRPEEPEKWGWERHIFFELDPVLETAIQEEVKKLLIEDKRRKEEVEEKRRQEELLKIRRHSPIT